MNIKKELVNTLKNLVGLYFGKVYSDSELKISNKDVGGKVEFILPDGELAPATDGEYTMDNGFSFTVKDGVIDSIMGEAPAEQAMETTEVEAAVEAPIAPEVEDPAEEAAPAEDVAQEDPAMVELSSRVDGLEAKLNELLSKMEGMAKQGEASLAAIETFNAEVRQLNSNIQTLAKVPVEFTKTNKTQVVEESKEEKLSDIARIIGNVSK
jgi:outer membrane murein-binding lipoprotein Lpp